jgi:autotransporter-associated beta strand protein
MTNNWSAGMNWVGGAAPVAGAATSVTFDGAVGLTPNQNIADPFLLNRIIMAAGAGARTISGDKIQFGGATPRLTMDSGADQVISAPIDLSVATTFNGAAGGARKLSLSGAISGAHGLTKEGAYRLVFEGAGANTYAGVTTINNGYLDLKKPNNVNAIAGNVVIGGGVAAHGLRLLQSNQIANTATVTVNAGAGTFDLNGFNERIGVLTGGGNVGLGSGTLATGGAGAGNPYSGSISGTGNLIKDGANTLVLSGANPYTGTTTVEGGVLTVNGSIAAAANRAGQVTVKPGATLNGKGKVFARGARGVEILWNGKIKAGNSPGILELNVGEDGSVAMDPGSIFEVEIDGPTPGNGPGYHSQLDVVGDVLLGDGIQGPILDVILDSPPELFNEYVILNNDSVDSIFGSFEGLPEATEFFVGGARFQISYMGGDGNDVVLTNVAVPEPSSLLLIGLVIGGIMLTRRKR